MNARSPCNPCINEELLRRHLIFLGGKGGVGKTTLSRALVLEAHARGRRVHWVVFDPNTPPLRHADIPVLTLQSQTASQDVLQEYLALKFSKALKWIPFAKQLMDPKLLGKWIHLLADAAPGISDLLMLGKIWHLRTTCDVVVVDLPSTGHGLQLFQSVLNFDRLFHQSLLTDDLTEMLKTLRDPAQTASIIVTLPEEGPVLEALELEAAWMQRFPTVRPIRWINALTPDPGVATEGIHPTVDFLRRRHAREQTWVQTWKPEGLWAWTPGLGTLGRES